VTHILLLIDLFSSKIFYFLAHPYYIQKPVHTIPFQDRDLQVQRNQYQHGPDAGLTG